MTLLALRSCLPWLAPVRLSLLVLCALLLASLRPAFAQPDAQVQLTAVFLGRFASYVQWPEQGRSHFEIVVLGKHPLQELLPTLYASKILQGKPVRVRSADSIADLGAPDLLYVAAPTVALRQQAIDFAQRHGGVLTVSGARGFAEAGGIIQISFVGQNAQIKINYDAAVQTGLRIGAPLLSIATVLREGKP